MLTRRRLQTPNICYIIIHKRLSRQLYEGTFQQPFQLCLLQTVAGWLEWQEYGIYCAETKARTTSPLKKQTDDLTLRFTGRSTRRYCPPVSMPAGDRIVDSCVAYHVNQSAFCINALYKQGNTAVLLMRRSKSRGRLE